MANNYWHDRELKNIEANIRKDRRTVKELRKQYKRALDDIEDDIERFYGRYATREGISLEEAQKRVTKADISKYEAKAKKYVKERNFSPKANREMRIYNVKMQMSRLELLKKEIELELLALVSEEERIHYERYFQAAIDEYKYQSGILGETLNQNEKTIEKIRDHLNNGKTEKRDPNQTAELVTVIKRKKGRATVVMINGDRYILDMGMRK